MAGYNPQELNDAIISIIHKDRMLADKAPLLQDVTTISAEGGDLNKKLAAYDRLIKYVSYLPKWDDELISYLGNRFAELKVKE